MFSGALPQKSQHSANGARYESQGQARSASPLVTNQNSDPALKGRYGAYVGLSGLNLSLVYLPGATRSASLRACPWLSYLAPLALSSTFEAKLPRAPEKYRIASRQEQNDGNYHGKILRFSVACLLRGHVCQR